MKKGTLWIAAWVDSRDLLHASCKIE